MSDEVKIGYWKYTKIKLITILEKNREIFRYVNGKLKYIGKYTEDKYEK
jgi:hypothetical protein